MTNSENNKLKILVVVVVILLITLPRLIGLDKFVTVDEPSWVGYGANFYYSLGQKEINEIQVNYTPGITTMILGALSIHILFPEYRGFGQDYLWKDDLGVADILLSHGQQPMGVLVGARVFMIITISIVLVAIFFYTRRLIGGTPALLSVLLISLDPYYLGHSRLLTQEGLISVLLILSIISYIAFMHAGKRKLDIFVSAFAGSIACLTKSSGTIIIPFIVLMSIKAYYENRKGESGRNESVHIHPLRDALSWLLIWLGIFIFTYVAFWPSLWVEPREALERVYGSVFNMVVGDVEFERFTLSNLISFFLDPKGYVIYLRSILTKTTPLVWLGLVIALANLMIYKASLKENIQKRILMYLFIFTVLFYIMMSLGKNKVSPHYIMTAIVCVIYIAGNGIAIALEWLYQKNNDLFRNYVIPGILVILIIFQLNSLIPYYPYYFTYVNPLIQKIDKGILSPQRSNYGEGLDLAAEYLSQRPKAEKVRVMSWYSGVFAYMFPGKVRHLAPRARWSEAEIDKLERSDYLVIYYEQQKRRNLPPKLMADLEGVMPEHSIFLNGIEYVRIYEVNELPDNVFLPDD